jgi:predicted GIY-YIG superfamily endonuclease
VRLAWSELLPDRAVASRREHWLKSLSRSQKLQLIASFTESKNNISINSKNQ